MLDAQTKEWLSKPACSVAQAAEMLGMSGPGVIRAIERGDIRSTRIGKRIIIPTAQIRRMLMLDDAALSANAA
ncbi:helix-turn-helix domain-containing protein [Methylobacterium sp. J-088]|uniref:helix-turn-helix domain-containing protein n=1 Tax=Methylobacterium sp. J-088 TaxID=2836664 RepID=UPI001FB873C5|nr:helix-turn-helix domain-containing protein [Methylobacterium sp. J-088]MCJ2065894.1 helix-turn-helix domain-containing protein [Methylobacterium sp. J-088]